MYHSHSKHIEVRYHWLRLVVEQQSFELKKIYTDENPADMLTKVVSRVKLKLCAKLASMNSDWRLGLKISSVVGWRGRLLGAKHFAGLAHMPCQSSLMSLLPQASKVSFRFNAKLSKCVRHAEEKRKKQKARVIWPWGKSWSKRAIRPFFGVSSRESKTQKRERFNWEVQFEKI